MEGLLQHSDKQLNERVSSHNECIWHLALTAVPLLMSALTTLPVLFLSRKCRKCQDCLSALFFSHFKFIIGHGRKGSKFIH